MYTARTSKEDRVAVNMADRWFRVMLDLERIRKSLSREDGSEHSLQHVRNWLREAGFHPYENEWLVREADLGQVDPSEVTEIEEFQGLPPEAD